LTKYTHVVSCDGANGVELLPFNDASDAIDYMTELVEDGFRPKDIECYRLVKLQVEIEVEVKADVCIVGEGKVKPK